MLNGCSDETGETKKICTSDETDEKLKFCVTYGTNEIDECLKPKEADETIGWSLVN